MANTGFKGLNAYQTGAAVVFRAALTASGAALSTGTTNLNLFELQSDGSLKTYDFADNTFKTTAVTTFNQAMTERAVNNATVHTGIWSFALSTLTGFTTGAVYLWQVGNSLADSVLSTRSFQYGGAEGDLVVTSIATGQSVIEADAKYLGGTLQTGADVGAASAHLDANVSSRSTYAGADTSGTTTLLGRITGLLPLASDYTSTRAGKLDDLDAAISSRSIYAGADTSGTATLLGLLTAARAGYLDNLNVGGAVASHADVAGINLSASKHMTLQTPGQYAPGETYTVEMRTYAAATGAAVNADTTPTISPIGMISGSLAGSLGALSNPAMGVYRATYTPGATPTNEQIRFDGAATIGGSGFTLSCYTQIVVEPTAVFTVTDKSNITAIFNKLPTNNIADQTLVMGEIDAQSADVQSHIDSLIPARFLMTGGKVWAIDQDGNDFVPAPSVNDIMNGLFTSGTAYQLTVNADGSVNSTGSGGGGGDVAPGPINIISAFNITGTELQITQGDDYAAAINTSLKLSIANRPELIGGKAYLRFQGMIADFAVSATIISGTQVIVFADVNQAETDLLTPGPINYEVRFVKDSLRTTPIVGSGYINEGY